MDWQEHEQACESEILASVGQVRGQGRQPYWNIHNEAGKVTGTERRGADKRGVCFDFLIALKYI